MTIRLTQTVQKGGCAAKIPAEILRQTLSGIDLRSADPNVLIDGRDFDDAGIYKINDDLALVQTCDFFTPIVDTPFLFGQVAAANALSDVYAMGGEPKTALGILAFPILVLDPSVMREILEGANQKVKESGASLVGGHSIDDDTIKFGLSVTGLVNPRRMWVNSGALPGDRLILTKAIGTGSLMAALKASTYTEAELSEAIESMLTLNALGNILTPLEREGIHSATDVTGFGIMGHSLQMARASGVSLRVARSRIPLFELTLKSLEKGHLTRAHRTNRSYTESEISWQISPNTLRDHCLFDPQTSGGLLLAVAPEKADGLLTKIRTRFSRAEIVGDAVTPGPSRLEVVDEL